MAGLVRFSLNTTWPVSLAEAKNLLRLNHTMDDALLQSVLIPAATIYMENNTGLTLASRDFIQFQDSFPFYPYAREPYGTLYGVGALSLYFGYGPIVPVPFPPFGLGNQDRLPFQIDLMASPATNVDHIHYIGSDGNPHDIYPGQDFVVDLMSSIARVTPLPGSVWPQCTIGPNNVQIYLTAGLVSYDPYSSPPIAAPEVDVLALSPPTPPSQIVEQKYINALPEDLKVGVMMALSHFYFNRDAVVSGNAVTVPHGLDNIIGLNKVLDFSLGLR